MKYLVEVFWSEEDQGYIAIVPDLPGCSAWGASAQDAVREIEHAESAWIQACEKAGEPLPRPSAQARHVAAG